MKGAYLFFNNMLFKYESNSNLMHICDFSPVSHTFYFYQHITFLLQKRKKRISTICLPCKCMTACKQTKLNERVGDDVVVKGVIKNFMISHIKNDIIGI